MKCWEDSQHDKHREVLQSSRDGGAFSLLPLLKVSFALVLGAYKELRVGVSFNDA